MSHGTHRYRFAIHGTGLIAAFHARAIAEVPDACLVGFCGRDARKTRALAEQFRCGAFTDLDAALDQADVLCVATPSGLHLESVLAAARRGRHVLCEKPLEVTAERIDAMIAAHQQAGTRLACIFQMRHIPALAPLRAALREGRFGTVTHVGIHVPWWRNPSYYDDSPWHGRLALDGGGALMNQAVHMIDLLCDLFPPPDEVRAVVSSAGHNIEAEDAAVAALKWADGMVGVIHGTTSAWPGGAKRLEIFGTEGAAVLTDDAFSQFEFRAPRPEDAETLRRFGQRVATAAGAANPGAMTHELHAECFRAFVGALDRGDVSDADARSARRPIALIQRIYEAAR